MQRARQGRREAGPGREHPRAHVGEQGVQVRVAVQRPLRRVALGAIILLALFGIAATLLAFNWPFTSKRVTRSWEQLLQSNVQTGHFQKTFFPHPGYIAEEVVISPLRDVFIELLRDRAWGEDNGWHLTLRFEQSLVVAQTPDRLAATMAAALRRVAENIEGTLPEQQAATSNA